ncbi:RNAse P Rpr2/Rpp21/SNM1 subunit domain-containing protein [Leptodontidium sp. 2 PMI_412]|nr:RNAse P Rpr2/Rpp21/SNM1 subunit domain-containing protein [Leptodontidium sp. MPI-SDFR-AT-0119]KAH9224728.1 RNAse P Rpr2/Rpp21/SNM1 subunit domain-containing protein [Leptodontidium sp. 2 PMI_412]
MAKPKTGSVPNKALYSRVSYLYQAAAYMATLQPHSQIMESRTTANGKGRCEGDSEMTSEESRATQPPLSQPASRRLVSDLRAVSHKVLMRISPAMKHSLCKNCDTMMIDGSTCTSEIENRSKGGKKPWADILVRRCNTCGLAKRFPLAVERQKRRPQRKTEEIVELETPS